MFSCTFSIDWSTCYLQIGKVMNSYFQAVGPVPGDGSRLCHTVLCNLNKKNLLCDCWWQNGFPMHKNNLDVHHRKDRLGLLFLVPWSKTYLVTDILCGLCPSELPKENSNFQQTKRCGDLKYLSRPSNNDEVAAAGTWKHSVGKGCTCLCQQVAYLNTNSASQFDWDSW